MKLAVLRELDGPAAQALWSIGIRTVADLARQQDVNAVAGMSGLPLEKVQALQEAARGAIVRAFLAAGAGDEAALAAGDPRALSEKTGIAVEDVEWFQAAARESLAKEPEGGTRIVLSEGGSTARVLTPQGAVESVRIVTARASDDPQALLTGAPGDAVVLQAGAPVASARVGGVVHREIPIFRDDGEKLTRVRVAEVRERPATEERPSVLDRLWRRR